MLQHFCAPTFGIRIFGQGNSSTTSRRRAALKSSPALTENKAASMALQTQTWETEVKDGLALPPLLLLLYNNSYP
ncbi:hypothetical protein EJ02DRAFT_456196 [Clathrospora elynae]|uniref:Uncharacterized protein n=1 Tax=Clathrospora elynae TaxID=706981 RepID=A0A6A5SJE2_9PLEO|nr:hypothetical protein EJ02DRAFT_456196 [Clathrospora elynae]